MASLVAGQALARTLLPAAGNSLSSKSSSLRTSRAHRRQVQVVKAVSETEKTEEVAEPLPSLLPNQNVYENPYTGVKTDSAGVTVIDVIEPKAYVSEGGSSSTGIAVAGALAALAGAAAVLFFLGGNQPAPVALSLSEYSRKFQTEVSVSSPVQAVVLEEAAAAVEEPVEVAEAVVEEPAAVPEAVDAPEVVVEESVDTAVAELGSDSAMVAELTESPTEEVLTGTAVVL